MHINWYPGHMAKARRIIEEYIKKVDVVIELLDARIPRSSANPIISELIGNKPHIVILNKSDLSDPQTTKEWTVFFQSQGLTVLPIDSRTGKGMKMLLKAVENQSAPIIDKWVSKGIKGRSIRTIILGIPNVGKSTLINILAGTAATRTADKPGHTRGQQWVRIAKNMELLDTPGVLWPKLEDQRAAARLAMTGAISDDVFDMETVVNQLIKELILLDRASFVNRYNLRDSDMETAETITNAVGKKRGCLMSGGVVDVEKARRLILQDYRNTKLGLVTLDRVDEEPYYAEVGI